MISNPASERPTVSIGSCRMRSSVQGSVPENQDPVIVKARRAFRPEMQRSTEALDEHPSETAPGARDLGSGGAAPSSRIQSVFLEDFASRFEQDTVPGT